jgi:intracellular septation protein A
VSELSFRDVLRVAGPRVARDGIGPPLLFYVGWKTIGFGAGIAFATTIGVVGWWFARRQARSALLARMTLSIVLLQAVVGLATGSARIYLAQSAIIGLLLGSSFLASAAIGRPIIGAIAEDVYPIPDVIRASEHFRHRFRVVTLVWGSYLVVRAVTRLVVLGVSSVEVFLVVTAATGTPVTVVLVMWSVAYALRGLRPVEPEVEPPVEPEVELSSDARPATG